MSDNCKIEGAKHRCGGKKDKRGKSGHLDVVCIGYTSL
jgi:hypothetical protein